MPFDDWTRRFEGSLKENANIQSTLMILDDSLKTTAAKRIWCLLEAAHTLKAKKKLEFAFLSQSLVLSAHLFGSGVHQLHFVDIIHSRCGGDEDYIKLAKVFFTDSSLALRNELNRPKILYLIQKALHVLSHDKIEEFLQVGDEI
jgi:hypothetical protein